MTVEQRLGANVHYQIDPSRTDQHAKLALTRFRATPLTNSYFRFAFGLCQRILMEAIDLAGSSLEIGINDGCSAAFAHFGKPKLTYGGDMPEGSTLESMGLYIEPRFDVYENVIGMDAHDIPFPDGSFNTVISNDMLSYGLDRRRILSEMVRVLAPGGRLFVTETTGQVKKYPYLLRRLRSKLPTFDVLDDAASFYRELLSDLGLTSISAGTYLDHNVCAAFLADVYTAPSPNEETWGIHEDGLRGVAALVERDLRSADREEGWQVFATAVRPVRESPQSEPVPMCLRCGAPLDITLDTCRCTKCDAEFPMWFGNPFVLVDASRSYSPKGGAQVSMEPTIRTLLNDLPEAIRTGSRVALFGIDKSTRYLIRKLRAKAITIEWILSQDEASLGHNLLGTPITSLEQAQKLKMPIVLSGYYGQRAQEYAAALVAAGFQGPLYAMELTAGRWIGADLSAA